MPQSWIRAPRPEDHRRVGRRPLCQPHRRRGRLGAGRLHGGYDQRLVVSSVRVGLGAHYHCPAQRRCPIPPPHRRQREPSSAKRLWLHPRRFDRQARRPDRLRAHWPAANPIFAPLPDRSVGIRSLSGAGDGRRGRFPQNLVGQRDVAVRRHRLPSPAHPAHRAHDWPTRARPDPAGRGVRQCVAR